MSAEQTAKKSFTGFPEGKQRLVPLPGRLLRRAAAGHRQPGGAEDCAVRLLAAGPAGGHVSLPAGRRFPGRRTLDEEPGRHPPPGGGEPAHCLGRTGAARLLTAGSRRRRKGRAEARIFSIHPGDAAAVSAIAAGEWRPTGDAQRPVEVRTELPNIYRLYEDNIGAITPLIADELREAGEQLSCRMDRRSYAHRGREQRPQLALRTRNPQPLEGERAR